MEVLKIIYLAIYPLFEIAILIDRNIIEYLKVERNKKLSHVFDTWYVMWDKSAECITIDTCIGAQF